MISTFTALFDANAIYGARNRSLLMELAMSGLFRARWSADIHREWMEAVHKNTGIPIEKLEATRAAMDNSLGFVKYIIAFVFLDKRVGLTE